MMDFSRFTLNFKDKQDFDEIVVFPKEIYENSEIVDLKNVHITGRVSKDYDANYILNCHVEGTMVLLDAVTVMEKPLDFSFDIEDEVYENDANSKNYLDIIEILWQNILLEIPLRFTDVDDTSSMHGNGWKVISEEDRNHVNNPFQDLMSKLGEE